MEYDTTLTRTELDRIVAEIEPAWRVRMAEATPSDVGHHVVYRLDIETPDGERACYLKATPPEKDGMVDLEARLLALLEARTDLPVPTVYGVVDAHDELPAPFLLLEAVNGDATPRIDPSTVSPAAHRRLARDTGRCLARLHEIDAVDAYGFLARDEAPLDGGRPGGTPDSLTVADPVTDWRERLREWTTETVAGLEASRFADLAPEAEATLDARIDDLDGPFDPVLARVDQSLENVLADEDGLTGLIDWEFTVAATPAYDLVHVGYGLAGGPFVFAPTVADRRSTVFEALLDGYAERDPDRATQARTNWGCYELLFVLRAMTNLTEWFPMVGLGEQTDEAAAALRTEVSL